MIKVGDERRREYQHSLFRAAPPSSKNFLIFSTYLPRCHDSAKAFLLGFSPLHRIELSRADVEAHLEDKSIMGSEFAKILDIFGYDIEDQCRAWPVVWVERQLDSIMRHETCPWLVE